MLTMDGAPAWVQDAVFYQIFPDRFANGDRSNDPAGVAPWGAPPTRENFCGGDLQGIVDRLDYLEDLGITALYLTPIFRARSNHKYDTCDYLEIDPAFGSRALLRSLVEACHRRGIRVVLDAVFNHCGDGFWAFEDFAQKGAASDYAGWFFPAAYPVQTDPPNYQTCGGAGFLPKLNTATPKVREYLLEVTRFWLEAAQIDGWRLDVPWKVPMDFWREFRRVVKQTNPQAYIAGEVWRDPAPWMAGDTCDGIMNYPLRDALLDYCVRDSMDAEDFDHTAHRLVETYGALAPSQLNLVGSHDTARILTVCGGDVARALVVATAQFTQVGAPMLYYGDEVGLQGENDPGCRGCMPWEASAWNQDLRLAYRALIHARKAHPALRRGTFDRLWVFNGVYAYRRCAGEDEALVILNPRYAQTDLHIPLSADVARAPLWRDLRTGLRVTRDADGLFLPSLPATSGLLLFPEP